MTIQWLLLDLGGVCLEVNQGAIYERLATEMGLDITEVTPLKVGHTPLWEDIGVRDVDSSTVYALFRQTLPKDISQSALIDCINAELGPPIEHTVQVLSTLNGKLGLGCLSNTNSIHTTKLLADYPVMELFSRKFFSQELRLRKPDRAIYERATELLKVPPQSILFFDDKEENVEGARQSGWRAYTYTGPQALLRGLELEGVDTSEGG